jgi:hypothetical protein
MLIAYLATKIQIIDNFTELYWSISNLAKISFLIGVTLLIFADTDSISTTGWQSAQYVAFPRLSLVYFGLAEDFDDIIGRTNVKTFQQVFVV